MRGKNGADIRETSTPDLAFQLRALTPVANFESPVRGNYFSSSSGAVAAGEASRDHMWITSSDRPHQCDARFGRSPRLRRLSSTDRRKPPLGLIERTGVVTTMDDERRRLLREALQRVRWAEGASFGVGVSERRQRGDSLGFRVNGLAPAARVLAPVWNESPD